MTTYQTIRSFAQLLSGIADQADNLPWHLSGSIKLLLKRHSRWRPS
jgi:hypothetical protein